MYYDLTKEEYKVQEDKFKKTYIGKQFFWARIVPIIIACVFWGIAGFKMGYNADIVVEFSLFDIFLIFAGGLCCIESILWHIQYRKELKNFIVSKK